MTVTLTWRASHSSALLSGVVGIDLPGAPDAWAAARLRSRHYERSTRALSMADCFLLATGARLGVAVATADPGVAAAARVEGIELVALPTAQAAVRSRTALGRTIPRVSADEQRRAIFESWETMAPGWERWRERIDGTTAPVREWLVRALAPRPGDTVLELAAGPGDTGLAAAELLGESGRVISTDLAPSMVEIARRRAAELGLTNVEHRVMDAERIELTEDSVDGVLCKFGYMLMPDQRAACAETRRVLRPGGRLALAVWRGSDLNPWISVAGRLLVERGLVPPPERGAPGIFALASEERLRGLLEGSGFSVDRTEDVLVSFVYADLDDYVSRARETGGVFARVWSEAPEQERAAIRAELERAFAQYEVEGRYELPGVALCAVAA